FDSIPFCNILTAIWLFGILATVGRMLIANRGASIRATRTLDLETRIKLLEKSTKAAEAAMDEFKSNNLRDLHSTARALIWVLNLDYEDSRISIYQRSDTSGEFLPLTRASINPKLELPGRPRYPDSFGLIAEAWERGRAHHTEWSKDPNGWVESQAQKFNIPQDVASGMKMQSR